MLTIHHLRISQSERIPWLCEELGIPYELKIYERTPPVGFAPPDYKALHPFGTAPILHDGSLSLGESGAIAEYLVHRYCNGSLAVGPDRPNYADYLYWLHFANGSFMPAVSLKMMIRAGSGDEQSEIIRKLYLREDLAYNMVEVRLARFPYLAGSAFTLADIMNFFPMTTFRHFGPRDLSAYPNIRAYLRRVGDRPAYRRAMDACEPGLALHLD
jgi:glutathione S-transferase